MSKAKHASRLAIALFAACAVAACTQSEVESSGKSAADPGHASGEHGSSSSAGLPAGRIAAGEPWRDWVPEAVADRIEALKLYR